MLPEGSRPREVGALCGVQACFAVRLGFPWLTVRRLQRRGYMRYQFTIDHDQAGQQTTPVEVLRAGAQRAQLGQYTLMHFAMERIGLTCQKFHQRFFVAEAGSGAFNKSVQGLDQTFAGLLLDIHPEHFNLGVDEFVANLAYWLPGKPGGSESKPEVFRGRDTNNCF